MSLISGNTWIVHIPATFIDSEALSKNITFYILAKDYDDNSVTSTNQYVIVQS